MAMKCKKCGGIIPDVTIGNLDRNSCKNHIKQQNDFKYLTKSEQKHLEDSSKHNEELMKKLSKL